MGVSAAIWLQRSGADVTLIDRTGPASGTSYGNGGILASCSMVPVTTPGLVVKAPGMLFNPDFPLFLRWSYLPKLAPWLRNYLKHANDKDTRRIAQGLTGITGDSLEQHQALATGTIAARFVKPSEYGFAYADRAAFEADSYVWELRREAGFVPDIVEGEAVREDEPGFGRAVNLLALVNGHGFVTSPGGYVQALAKQFENSGGTFVKSEVKDFDLQDGQIAAVLTDQGKIQCDAAVLSSGVWSKSLAHRLGLNVPMESERGYHIVFRNPSVALSRPYMVTAGKFVATQMEDGLRCAGVVEFGGLEAEATEAPFNLIRKKVRETFADLSWDTTDEWMGHRPAPADSLPLIGEIGQTGIHTAYGHHHIGLTGGPKTGRLVAGLIMGDAPNIDLQPYSPNRFA